MEDQIIEIIKGELEKRASYELTNDMIWKWVVSGEIARKLDVSTRKARYHCDKMWKNGKLLKKVYLGGCYAHYTLPEFPGYEDSIGTDYFIEAQAS